MSEPFIQQLVADAHRERQYRPVVVGIVFKERSTAHALFVCSAKNRQEAGFVQGSVERVELAVDALRRELSAKVGIGADHLGDPIFLGHADLDVEDNQPDRRGYARGKRYLFYRVMAWPTGELKLDSRELYSYIWLPPGQAGQVLATTRPAKRDLMLAFLSKAVSY